MKNETTMKKLLAFLPILALAVNAPTPTYAWSNQLQYRSTTCQVQRGTEIISRGKCNAGFAGDGVVRVIKYRWPNGAVELSVVGQSGTDFHGDDPTCLMNRYTDGDTLMFCTVGSQSDLGLRGD
jgi:hypothetical protein